MAFLVYTGGAMDHADAPGVLRKGIDGKPLKRKFAVSPKRDFFEVDVKKLWGQDFPKGEPVEVHDKALIKKAKALGCFEVRDVELQVELVAKPDAPEAQGEPVDLSGIEVPKKRGRFRRQAASEE